MGAGNDMLVIHRDEDHELTEHQRDILHALAFIYRFREIVLIKEDKA